MQQKDNQSFWRSYLTQYGFECLPDPKPRGIFFLEIVVRSLLDSPCHCHLFYSRKAQCSQHKWGAGCCRPGWYLLLLRYSKFPFFIFCILRILLQHRLPHICTMSALESDSNFSRYYFDNPSSRVQHSFVSSGPMFFILMVMMVTLVVVIVLGNALVILAFKVDKSLRKQCNYYFLNLAISDFLVGKSSLSLSSSPMTEIRVKMQMITFFPHFLFLMPKIIVK